MFTYPQDFGGPSLLSTPQFLYNWFPSRGGGIYGQAPSSGAAGGGGGGGGGKFFNWFHFWWKVSLQNVWNYIHNKPHFSKIFQAADLVAMLGVEETDLDNYNWNKNKL